MILLSMIISIYNWIKHLFVVSPATSTLGKVVSHEQEPKFVWCLVGNVVNGYHHPVSGALIRGTKHFSPGTKVYCFPIGWGDGYERIRVIGKHRKTYRRMLMIVDVKYITNWRLQQVYDPHILHIMKQKNGWTANERDKETILEMLQWLPEVSIKSADSIR
jgi:hypothetical protein